MDIYIIRALLPTTGGNAALKDNYSYHYFQGIADVTRQSVQQGGLTGTITVNAWTTKKGASAGFPSLEIAKKWLNVIGLPEAEIKRLGKYDADAHAIYRAKGRKIKPEDMPAHILNENTDSRIIIMNPINNN